MDKILVAYDGTTPSKRALHTAATLGKAFGATIGVVSVVPRRPGRSPWIRGTTAASMPKSSSKLVICSASKAWSPSCWSRWAIRR